MKNSSWYKEGFEVGNVAPDGKNPSSPYKLRSPKDLIWKEGLRDGYAQWDKDHPAQPVDTRLPPV